MAIRILVTGGTFDKEYNEINGELYFKEIRDVLISKEELKVNSQVKQCSKPKCA
jgi:L-asparaginase